MDFGKVMTDNIISDIKCIMSVRKCSYHKAKEIVLKETNAGPAIWEVVDAEFSK